MKTERYGIERTSSNEAVWVEVAKHCWFETEEDASSHADILSQCGSDCVMFRTFKIT